MKKLLALLLCGLLISMTACGGRNSKPTSRDTPADKPADKPATQFSEAKESEAAVSEKQKIVGGESETIQSKETKQPEENQKIDIAFQEQSYNFKDSDGYEFEVTIKISPWILRSNSDLINAAWNEVGGKNTLPTVESLGLDRDSSGGSNWYQIQRDMGIENGVWTFSCPRSGFDMYYAMGTISIKNTTSGFDLSEDNKRGIWLPFIYSDIFHLDREDSYEGHAFPAICNVFYSTPKTCGACSWSYMYLGKASMKRNSWGPVTFVLMYGESVSPNHPDGLHREYLNGSELVFYRTGLNHYPDLDNGYVSFYMNILDP